MRVYDILEKKKRNISLREEELSFLVSGFTKGEIPDYQMSAFLMATTLCGMNKKEVSFLTKAMIESGDILDLSSIQGIKVDKHSTGGVGDTTTLIISPIVASLGIPVAKMSGRGLGHTGGTIDKLEAIPNFKTNIESKDFIDIVNREKISIIGQTSHLAPADGKIYALRDVTATVDSIPLIASSIMSKKIASGADKILLDVKVGKGAFMETPENARELAKTMVDIGNDHGKETIAITTNMNEPLGRAIGNTLEVIEAIEVLQGNGPKDLRELSIELAGQMLFLADFSSLDICREEARKSLENGKAFMKFVDMVEAQGGDSRYIKDITLFEKPRTIKEIKAKESGFIKELDAKKLGSISNELGAGRNKVEDKIDNSAGIYCHKKIGEEVTEDDLLFTLYTNRKIEDSLYKELETTYKISKEKVDELPLIFDRINK